VTASIQLTGEDPVLFSAGKRTVFQQTIAGYMLVAVTDVHIVSAVDGAPSAAAPRTLSAVGDTVEAVSCLVGFLVAIPSYRAVDMSLQLHTVVASGQFVDTLRQNAAAVGVITTVQSVAIAVPPTIRTSNPSESLEFADMVTAREEEDADTPNEVVVVRSGETGGLIMLVVAVLLSCALGLLVLRKLSAHRTNRMATVGVDGVCVDQTSSEPPQKKSSKKGAARQSNTGQKVFAAWADEEETKEETEPTNWQVAIAPLPPASSLPYLQKPAGNPLAPAPAEAAS
jgi:hypothetical protein